MFRGLPTENLPNQPKPYLARWIGPLFINDSSNFARIRIRRMTKMCGNPCLLDFLRFLLTHAGRLLHLITTPAWLLERSNFGHEGAFWRIALIIIWLSFIPHKSHCSEPDSGALAEVSKDFSLFVHRFLYGACNLYIFTNYSIVLHNLLATFPWANHRAGIVNSAKKKLTFV